MLKPFNTILFLLLTTLIFITSCDSHSPLESPLEKKEDTTSTESKEFTPHKHHAPHGGTLIVFGEEFAHLELKLNFTTGQIQAWVLDGEAEKYIRLSQKEILFEIEIDEKKFPLSLKPVENTLTGETVGNTSLFQGQHPQLKDVSHFHATLQSINIKAQIFEKIEFCFPEGNEVPHDESKHLNESQKNK